MLVNKQPTNYLTEKEANFVSRENNETDPDWTYKVVPWGSFFRVEVFDGEDITLGYL